ncbi:MAG: DUF4147 domain-containing protein, partial [bacterium]
MRPLPDAFFRNRETEPLRRAAMRCLERALGAVDPGAAIRRAVQVDGTRLTVAGETSDLREYLGVFVVGGGKAAAAMAAALEGVLGDRLEGGVVSVKYGHAVPTARVEVREAGHPFPDAASVAAADAVLDL